MENIIQLRQQIAELQTERESIQRQRRSRDEVKGAFDAWLSAAEQQGREALLVALERAVVGQALTPCHVHGNAAVFATPGAAPVSLDIGPLLVAVLGKQAVRKSIAAYIDALPEGLDPAGKVRRLTEIEASLWRLETEEEARIVDLEESGSHILRRPDARPEIILT